VKIARGTIHACELKTATRREKVRHPPGFHFRMVYPWW
jgi:hypothetical protein